MAWTSTLILVLGIAIFDVSNGAFLSRLGDYVKGKSDPDVVPQRDGSHPVDVTLTYSVLNVADVDREHNTITTETLAVAQWDTGISWNPEDYDNVDVITLPAKYFWTPLLQPIHTAVEIRDLGPHIIILLANGTAAYSQVFKTPSLCDVAYVHIRAECNFKTSLWGYSKDVVNIKSVGNDPTGTVPFFAGSFYKLTGFSLNFVDLEFGGKTYQIIDSNVTIEEKSSHHSGSRTLSINF